MLRHPAALVRAGLARGGYALARARQRLGAGRNVFGVDLRAGGLVEAFGFGALERRALALFDGLRSLDQIARALGDEELVLRVALGLWAFGVLVPAVDRSAGVAPSGRAARDLRIDRDRVLARAALAREGDYFQTLGLDRSAEAIDVKRAYERLAEELSDRALGAPLAGELASELALVRSVLAEALRVLGSDTLRARYRAALPPERDVSSLESLASG
jgi:hypothetical protein